MVATNRDKLIFFDTLGEAVDFALPTNRRLYVAMDPRSKHKTYLCWKDEGSKGKVLHETHFPPELPGLEVSLASHSKSMLKKLKIQEKPN